MRSLTVNNEYLLNDEQNCSSIRSTEKSSIIVIGSVPLFSTVISSFYTIIHKANQITFTVCAVLEFFCCSSISLDVR